MDVSSVGSNVFLPAVLGWFPQRAEQSTQSWPGGTITAAVWRRDVANVPGYEPQWGCRNSMGLLPSRSLLGLCTWNMSLTNISIPTKKNSVWWWLHWQCSLDCITSFRLVNKASHTADLTAYPYCIFREWAALKALDAVMDAYRWML